MGRRRGWQWQPNYSRLAVQIDGEDVAYFKRNMWYLPPGHIYYVDSRSWGTAADTNSGITPDEPLATLTAAIAKCTSGAHDYVICLNGYDNDTSTITLAKEALHILGLGPDNHSAPYVWLKIAATGAAAVFTLTGASALNCEIAGFTLGADSTHPCITISGAGNSFSYIHDCAFAGSSDTAFVARDGINIPSETDAVGLLVDSCYFGNELTRDGVRIEGGMSYGRIKNCTFTGMGAVGVNHTVSSAVASMPDVLNCQFRADHGASEGWAITIQNATGGLIDGNHASADFTTADANPYLDHSDKSQWGLNYNVITAAAPATT